jgi:hypothetical protein
MSGTADFCDPQYRLGRDTETAPTGGWWEDGFRVSPSKKEGIRWDWSQSSSLVVGSPIEW